MPKSPYFGSNIQNTCGINFTHGIILHLTFIYIHIKFQVSTVSETCIFDTKNAESTLFLVIAAQIVSALTLNLVQ